MDAVVEKLVVAGIEATVPAIASAIKGTKHALRELRPKAGRSPLRIFYAFDPNRDALLLIGGDKSNDSKLYVRLTKQAEAIWSDYLRESLPPLGHKPKPGE